MIRFLTHDIPMPEFDTQRAVVWLRAVAADYGFAVGNLNYIFCSDEHILEVNRQFLSHDYFTDVITFDYSTRSTLAGDVFISVDTVASNAEQFGCSFQDELHRILVHGLLHLTGQNDKQPDDKQEMTRKENQALRKLKIERGQD